jgi:hypothetical protein
MLFASTRLLSNARGMEDKLTHSGGKRKHLLSIEINFLLTAGCACFGKIPKVKDLDQTIFEAVHPLS